MIEQELHVALRQLRARAQWGVYISERINGRRVTISLTRSGRAAWESNGDRFSYDTLVKLLSGAA